MFVITNYHISLIVTVMMNLYCSKNMTKQISSSLIEGQGKTKYNITRANPHTTLSTASSETHTNKITPALPSSVTRLEPTVALVPRGKSGHEVTRSRVMDYAAWKERGTLAPTLKILGWLLTEDVEDVLEPALPIVDPVGQSQRQSRLTM